MCGRVADLRPVLDRAPVRGRHKPTTPGSQTIGDSSGGGLDDSYIFVFDVASNRPSLAS